MMELTRHARVTIIAEALLEERLIREIKKLGTKGLTITNVRGEGSRGLRTSEWEGQNIKLETIASEDVANKVLRHVADNYFEHFAVIAYLDYVFVIRGEKYV